MKTRSVGSLTSWYRTGFARCYRQYRNIGFSPWGAFRRSRRRPIKDAR